MKKLLIIFLFISNLCFSQGHHTTIFRDSKLTDSILANGQNKLYIRSDIVGIYTRDTVRVLVDSLGNILMYGDVEMYQDLIVTGDIQALGDITGANLNGTLSATNLSGTIDTARIPNTAKIDTANFAHTNSGITEIFNSIVSFATTVTFTVSPVFSALVNFANGINVTGNGVFSGNVTADTLKGKGGQITNISKGITSYQSNAQIPADSTIYYWGSLEANVPNTTGGLRRVYFPVNCTIKACIIYAFTATAGTNENVAFYIRLNNTTDYTITTTGRLNAAASFVTSSNYSMSVPITAGDYIEFKVYTPNFATNPGNTYFHATIEFE